MEIYTDISKYEQFEEFISKHKDNIDILDIKQYYIGSISYNNHKVFEYILREYRNELEEEYIRNTIMLLFEPKYIDMIKICNNYNIDTNFMICIVISELCNMNNINRKELLEYYKYILYLVRNNKENILEYIYNSIKDNYTDINLKIVLELIDIGVIIGGNKIMITKDELNSIFLNMNNTNIKLSEDVEEIIKEIYNINEVSKINNDTQYITKIREDLYIYNDNDNTWCFNNENIEYIKKYYKNPFNGGMIENRIVKNL